MARRPDHQDTATCHFFINLGDNEVLDYKERTARGYGYCVFGELVGDESLATADRIGRCPSMTWTISNGFLSKTSSSSRSGRSSDFPILRKHPYLMQTAPASGRIVKVLQIALTIPPSRLIMTFAFRKGGR